MLAGMITRLFWNGSRSKVVKLPSPADAAAGVMIRLDGFLPHDEHGLCLLNGSLISQQHFLELDDTRSYRVDLSKQIAPGDNQILEPDASYGFNYITSLSEYLEWATQCNNRHGSVNPIFRGLPRSEYTLTTTFDRLMHLHSMPPRVYAVQGETEDEQDTNFWNEYENEYKGYRNDYNQRLLREFVTLHPEPFNKYSPIEWLVIARHSELPTPLLDFTRNPLIALYFALQFHPPSTKKNSDCFVYAVYTTHQDESHRETAVLHDSSFGHSGGTVIRPMNFSSVANQDLDTSLETLNEVGFKFFESPRSSSSAWLQKSILVSLPPKSLRAFYSYGCAVSHCVVRDNDRHKLIKELSRIGIDESSIHESATSLARAIHQRHVIASDKFGRF